MRFLFKIKWEVIVLLLSGMAVVLSILPLMYGLYDVRELLLILVSVTLFVVSFMGYESIRDFRKECLRLWK